VAVVTGAAGAIGTAVVEMLLTSGCAVAGWDQRAQEPSAGGRGPLPVHCDVRDTASVAEALDETHRRLGQVGFLVNAVGVGQYGEAYADTEPDRWRDIVDVNLVGAMRCVHAVLPDMLRRGAGVIVNVCSIWSTNTAVGRSAYIASKWGLLGATKAVALEVIGGGVRVCAVSPGPVDTPMTASIAPERVRRTWMGPSDVADAIAYALGPGAAQLVGGELQLFGPVRPFTGPGPALAGEGAS
jgi:NAD(P)-dependent dehydrogenase (short-subunit alcohol dehydrogenase family)